MPTNLRTPRLLRRAWISALTVLALAASAATTSAETLLMPKRDMLAGTQEVVWGVTTLANGTAFSIDFGDGSAPVVGNVADRSYINVLKSYALPGTYTIELTVGGEVATTEVRVFNPAALTPFELRGVNTNRAIENGLRYLWQAQDNRAGNFPGSMTTSWAGFGPPDAALIVLAFENHGYKLTNDNAPPTGIYEKYVVQRGLNYVASSMSTIQLFAQPAGNPCVGAGIEPAPCTGIYYGFDPGYSTAVSALPLAGSSALNRTFPAGLGGGAGAYIAGKTYREVLQRIMNAVAYGQGDSPSAGRGGWSYGFNPGNSDGSTVGWDVLALLDAGAAGITIPAFVKSEFQAAALPGGLNTSGSFDYSADNNPASEYFVNFQKGGIGLQGLFYVGQVGTAGNPQVQAGVNYLSNRWSGAAMGADYSGWACGNPSSNNKGCAYSMFNAFKALKLHAVDTLPGVNRPAGPGPIPANDWYADYIDWLLANQTSPTTATGGYWSPLGFSCCHSNVNLSAAMAELILAPVALITPDPVKFQTVGLSPASATNPAGTSHTVTAKAESDTGTPVPGATVVFQVISGPNAGKSGQGTTNAQGQATFTYTDTSAPPHGTDSIQAFIGQLGSNVVTKTWQANQVARCDADADGNIDTDDIRIIRMANGQKASSATDPRDGNGDGAINIADQRYCSLRCTLPQCAVQ